MSKIFVFLAEVRAELGRVVWPKRDELVGSTIVVCVLAVFFAVVLGGMDSVFTTLVKRLISG